MNAQLIICLVIFVLTLVSYLLNKVPMWVTAMISLAALYFTGCIDAAGALGGFSNVNTTLMAAMFIVAAGFRRTSLVDAMVNGIMKVTRGSFKLAYLGYLIIAVLLTNFISSPMVVYSIVSTLLCAYLDKNGYSRSKYIFPMMVVCVSCCGILPLATAIQQAGQNTGFLETYGFDITYEAIYPFMAGWPMLIIVPLWALFIGPKFLPETAPLPIAAKEEAKQKQKALSPLQDKIGIVLFFATIVLLIFSGQLGLETWAVALVGSLLMVVFGVADQKTVLRLLKTARGQIDGILKMVEEDRYCIDISTQVMAAEAMLNRANKEILTAHLKHCVNTAQTQEEREEKIDELVDMLGKILK